MRLGSVSEAAQEQGVTTAAIGARIRELERRLDRPLFRREGRGLVPLAQTRDVAGRLSDAMHAIANVQDTLSVNARGRRIALAVTQTFAENWLPRHMPSLMARLSGVDLRLDTSWDVVDLAQCGFDFAIRYMGEAGPAYGQVTLLPSGVVPVCTPSFAKRYGLRPGCETLDGIPVAHIDVPTSDPDWCNWDQWSLRTGIALGDAKEAHFTLSGSGLRVASSGMGLVLGGISEMFHELSEGRLVMPFGPKTHVTGQYWHKLIWPRDRHHGPLQRQFIDWITEQSRADRRVMQDVFEWAC